MIIDIRLKKPKDNRTVEERTREVLLGNFHPACDEHYLVHLLRCSKDLSRQPARSLWIKELRCLGR